MVETLTTLSPPSAGRVGGQNSFPKPPSFLPACLGFASKFFERADDGAEIRKEENKAVKTLAPPSRARVFDILFSFYFTILKYFSNIMLWERSVCIN
jgi:hypothetical protein